MPDATTENKAFFKSFSKKPNEVLLLNVILGLSISLLLLVAFFVNQKFTEASDNVKEISKANLIIIKTSNLETYIFKIGNDIRKAVLVRNNAITDSLPLFWKDADKQVSDIRSLSAGNINNASLLDSLSDMVEERFKLWDGLILSQASPYDSSQTAYATNANMIFGKILGLTGRIKDHEYYMLNKYQKNSQSGIKTASLLVIIITLLSIALIVFAFTRINREVRRVKVVGYLLENKLKELDRSNQQLEQFAYAASHDLHDPLRKLSVFVERLDQKEGTKLSEEGKELMRRMQRLTGQMQNLIDGILSLSLNYHQQNKATVSLNKVLEDAKQNLSIKIQSSGAVVNAVALPTISGYESQLDQLFQNLISNSIRYAQKDQAPCIEIKYNITTGDVVNEVRIEDKKKQFHHISFNDNGIGFDNKYAEKIFVIFQRLHGKSEYEGSGIGLATCKQVVENHNGYITANGKVNQGAQFDVYLPVS